MYGGDGEKAGYNLKGLPIVIHIEDVVSFALKATENLLIIMPL